MNWIGLFIATMASLQVSVSQAQGKPFSLIYVENSSPGLDPTVKESMEQNVNDLAIEGSFLFFISNAYASEEDEFEYYTPYKNFIQKTFQKLSEGSIEPQSMKDDKEKIWRILNEKNQLANTSEVQLHYYFTDNYLNQIIDDKVPSYSLLSFLPSDFYFLLGKQKIAFSITMIIYTSPAITEEVRKKVQLKAEYVCEEIYRVPGFKCIVK